MPGSFADAGEERELLARLRAVIGAKDAEIAVLREQCRRLELKVAELERRLESDALLTEQRGRYRSSEG